MGPQDEAGLRRWVETALANAEAGTERPFATIDRTSGRAIGSTRYMSIVPEHKRLEIGWTWIATAFQRTGANREAKLLQLTHAFETLGANRVEFKTHSPERALAHGPRRHRGDVRGRLPPAHDHARRLAPRLGLLQRHLAGVARGQGPPPGRPGLVSPAPTSSMGRRPIRWRSTAICSPEVHRPSSGRRSDAPSSAARSCTRRRAWDRGFLIGTAATAITFAIVAYVLPQIDYGDDLVSLIVLSLIAGVVNGFIKPIIKLFSLPLTVMTLGLFGLVINAGMLLLIAWIADLGGRDLLGRRLPAQIRLRRDRRGVHRRHRDHHRRLDRRDCVVHD